MLSSLYMKMLSSLYILIFGFVAVSQSTNENCSRIMDLCFLADSSLSVCESDPTYDKNKDSTCNNWEDMKSFMYNTVDRLDIGYNATRVAMVVFSTKGIRKWNLTKYSNDKPGLLAAIDKLEFIAGKTNTSGGLNVMMDQVFNENFGDRKNVTDVALIITDGKATNLELVPAATDRVHGAGVNTYAIGITNQIDEKALRELASYPKEVNVTYFPVPDFNILDRILPTVRTQICRELPTTISTTTTAIPTTAVTDASTSCPRIMDLVFVVDSSASICGTDPEFDKATDETCGNWFESINFMSALVDRLDISENATRVGAVSFATKGYKRWNLKKYTNKASLKTAIAKLPYSAGHTNISGGLDVMRTMVFQESQGDRPKVPDVAMIITDGRATDPPTVQYAVDRVHEDNIRTYAIGVTKKQNEESVKQLASEPRQKNKTYFTVPDFNTMDQILDDVTKQICNDT